MAVLTDILEWSNGRPMWQRDALRRIVTQSSPSAQDVTDLYRICLAQRGILDAGAPAPDPTPLATEHIPTNQELLNRVQLIGLRDIRGVNALAAGQRMSFQLDGMTIVFGYNGSGKSGYARVLRSLCHARHRGSHILQDVFADGHQPAPSATVDYRVGGSEHSTTWQEGQSPPIALRQVSFFDADCAAVHVEDTNELAFTPFGLDVLPKLATVCQQISQSINTLIREQERARPLSLSNLQPLTGTSVRAMLDSLNENTDIAPLRRLADRSGEEQRRIVELQEALGTDPARRARELRNAATRLLRLQTNIQQVDAELATDVVERIRNKLQDLNTKRNTAKVAAEQAFAGQPLSGVGEDVWQKLWEAARNYSEQTAYPDQEFPFVGDDARCVLCHQPLSPDAQSRLTAFERFVKAETQQAAEQAEAELTQMLFTVQGLTVGHAAYSECLLDLPEDEQALKRAIRRFCGIAWKIRLMVLRSCKIGQWIPPSTLPTSPMRELNGLIQGLLRRAQELEQAATAQERRALLNEHAELHAHQWLRGTLHDVEAEIARRKKLTALNAALSDTATTGITRKSSELADIYVTDVLRDRLASEITKLGAAHLRVELYSPGGRFGQKQFKICLRQAREDAPLGQVLSEGEFRCIALAGFLAELSTEHSNSALVFDDPVCSLDDQWRRKMALRLAQLASERQVIVFTHDIVFLIYLVEYCKRQNIQLRQSCLHRGPDRPGECIDGVPWETMPVGRRIGLLKQWLQGAEATHRRQDQNAYAMEARRIYERLRETWEHAVEEVLLNGVVMRFSRAIHTQQLNRLADITEDDIRIIDQGMTKASLFLHDQPAVAAEPVPGPDELRDDVHSLETWVSHVRQRRQ